MADPGTGHAAACHAGWRGVASRILPEAIRQLEALGAHRSDLLVAFGPAISGQHYQVGDDVVVALYSARSKNFSQALSSPAGADPTQSILNLIPAIGSYTTEAGDIPTI